MKNKITDYTIDEIKSAVKSSDTFREVALKLGYTNFGGGYKTLRKIIDEAQIDYSHMTHIGNKRNPNKQKLLAKNVLKLNSPHSNCVIREIIKRENLLEYKCQICGQLPEWNNKPLTLTLDHINGNSRDNRLENLRFVCPNCDRQLDTFGSKNRHSYFSNPCVNKNPNYNINTGFVAKPKYKCKFCDNLVWKENSMCKSCLIKHNRKKFPNINQLNEAIKLSSSMLALGRYFGISDNGMRKRLKVFNIPIDAKGYRSYRNKLLVGGEVGNALDC